MLPFNYYFISSLVGEGYEPTLVCSKTKYNGDYIAAIRALGVRVESFRVSRTVSNNKLELFLEMALVAAFLWKQRKAYEKLVNMFSPTLLLDLLLTMTMAGQIGYMFHNPIDRDGSFLINARRKIRKVIYRVHWYASGWFADEALSSGSLNTVNYVQHGLLPFLGVPVKEYEPPLESYETLCFWGNVKPYKGIGSFLDSCKGEWQEQFKRLLIIGRGAASLPAEGDWCKVIPDFLTEGALEQYLTKDNVYFLPYLKIAQSGVFYSLLARGLYFFVTNQGEPAAVFAKFRLSALILKAPTIAEVHRCHLWMATNRQFCYLQFSDMQQWASQWKIEEASD